MNTKEEELKSKVYDLFTEVKLFYKQEGRTQMLEKVKEKIEKIIRLCPAECVNRWIQFEDELSKLEDDEGKGK